MFRLTKRTCIKSSISYVKKNYYLATATNGNGNCTGNGNGSDNDNGQGTGNGNGNKDILTMLQ